MTDRREAYRQKLLDPRWQKLRLRVMERDSFMCQRCGATDKTLHVHHVAYNPLSVDPWDTEKSALVTVCADCHEAEHDLQKQVLYWLVVALGDCGIRGSADIENLLARFESVQHETADGRDRRALSEQENVGALATALTRFLPDKAADVAAGVWFGYDDSADKEPF